MPSDVLCIGVHHTDPHGRRRLLRALDWYRPDAITIELSDEHLHDDPEFFCAISDAWLGDWRALLKTVDGARLPTHRVSELLPLLCFELFGAQAHAQRHGTPIFCIDEAGEEGRYRPLMASYRPEFMMSIDRLDDLATLVYISDPLIVTTESLLHHRVIDRDAVMERAIRAIPGRVAHVGGLAHIYGTYRNLYDRLSDLHPKRLRLCDADRI